MFDSWGTPQDSERMTEDQFVSNNRGIDQDGDLDPELLRAMYRRLKVHRMYCCFVGRLGREWGLIDVLMYCVRTRYTDR